jgi:hypothetical protein
MFANDRNMRAALDRYITKEQDCGPECVHMIVIADPKGIELAEPVCLIDCLICVEQCKIQR